MCLSTPKVFCGILVFLVCVCCIPRVLVVSLVCLGVCCCIHRVFSISLIFFLSYSYGILEKKQNILGIPQTHQDTRGATKKKTYEYNKHTKTHYGYDIKNSRIIAHHVYLGKIVNPRTNYSICQNYPEIVPFPTGAVFYHSICFDVVCANVVRAHKPGCG